MRKLNKMSCELMLATVLSILFPFSVQSAPDATCEIRGRIFDEATGQPLPDATVTILDKLGGAIAGPDGAFIIKNLDYGTFRLKISHIGYKSTIIDSLKFTDSSVIQLNVRLISAPASIRDITVVAGRFSIMGQEPTTRQILTREEVETRPQFGEDVFRAVHRLPGLASSDYAAKFNVRGGEQDEVLITYDGMQLYEPFHMRSIDGGALSIIDLATVYGIDLMTGGYPATYGDRSSGVINIISRNPANQLKHTSLGLSTMNVRFMHEGTFANNRGSYFVSGRKGFVGVVLRLADADDGINPSYYDLNAKCRYQLDKNNVLVANVLHSNDDFKVLDAEKADYGDTLISSYGNYYVWLTLHSVLSDKTTSHLMAYLANVNQRRFGINYNKGMNKVTSSIRDNRDMLNVGIKSDWEYEPSPNHLVRAGLEFRNLSSDYYYNGLSNSYYYDPNLNDYVIGFTDTTFAVINPSGNRIIGYLTNRYSLTQALAIEAGVRYDNVSYTGEKLVSPRLNAAYNFSPATSIKIGWGYFYQIERIDEIGAGDKELGFREAERAEHFVAGLEHKFIGGTQLRFEGYYKRYTDLRPAFRNISGQIEFYLERNADRVEVTLDGKRSRGVEFYLRRDAEGKFNWWLSYAWSMVDDNVKSLSYVNLDSTVVYNRSLPYPFDQRHTIYIDASYRPNLKWQFNIAWHYHTGWPRSRVEGIRQTIDGYYYVNEAPWEANLTPFSRLDVRINRRFYTSKGTLSVFLEIINILNRENVRNYEYSIYFDNGSPMYFTNPETWFGIMPSIGITYDFDM